MKFKFIKRKNDPGLQDGSIAEENPQIEGVIADENNSEIQDSPAAENITEVQDKLAAENIAEVQDSLTAENIAEANDSNVSEDISNTRTSLFKSIFRKPSRIKAAKVEDSSAAESIPEIQNSVTAENSTEVQDSITSEEIQSGESAGQSSNISGKNIFLTKKKPWTLAKKIIVSVSSVVVIAVLIAGLFLASISINPLGGFKTASETSYAPMPTVNPEPSGYEEVEGPSPTPDPYEVLKAQADFSMLEGIVNVLLIGVDHGEERDADKWKGKTAWHSDVMIIVSINTNTNKVSLISLPRDTYAKIPGVSGIYKLNAALNCGGGWPKPEAFQKVCDAASWMIGGIPIQYYYAVDFNAVKDLVDAIGGVDFDLDIAFEINGRSYKTGKQHMTGQGALDYMRVRKKENIDDPHGETGDLNRINRQKAMLVAIFDKLKSTGTIFSLPDILGAFEGNLYTNVPIEQTAGLAAYAYKNIDPKTISVASMDGNYAYWLFDWHFVITDLGNRVKIIRDVYGIDISKDKQYKEVYAQYKKYTHNRAWSMWFNMQTEVALKKSKGLLEKAKKILDEDAPPTTTPGGPSTPPTDKPAPPSVTPAITIASSGKYGAAERQLYETAQSEYNTLKSYSKSSASDKRKELIEKYKKDVQALCKALSIKVSNWDNLWKVVYNSKSGGVNQHYVKNEIYVDFR